MIGNEECVAIIRFLRRGNSVSSCSRLFARARGTILGIVRRGGPARNCRRMAPARRHRAKLAKKIASRIERRGDRLVPAFPSAQAIANQLKREFNISVSRRRVSEDLHALGGNSRVRPKVPTRSVADRQVQRNFCRRNLKVPWKKWAFSDETWVTANEGTSRTMWIFPGQNVLPREFKSKFNIPSVQVWLAFGFGWRAPVVVFPMRANRDGESRSFRLDADSYIRKCLSVTAPLLSKHQSILVQDGARAHVARNVRAYAKRKGLRLTFDWPPYSPVLNQAEPLNAIFKRRVAEYHPRTLDELVAACHAAWRSIPQSMLNNFVAGFQKKLKEFAK